MGRDEADVRGRRGLDDVDAGGERVELVDLPVERLQALDGQIDELDSLAAGVDVVQSPASAHVGLVTTHADLGALKSYQAHPAHQDFLAWLGPRLASRTVADFES